MAKQTGVSRRVIEVTREDIDNAVPRDSKHCMISDAVQRAEPEAIHVISDLQQVRFSLPSTGRRYFYTTPALAVAALVEFDRADKKGNASHIPPFTLKLTRDYSTVMRCRQEGFVRKPSTAKPKKRATYKRVVTSRYRKFGARALVE